MVEVEDIWLMHEKRDNFDYAVVYVKMRGIWYEAIREHIEGPFSHCISHHGLKALNMSDAPAWMNEGS